VDVTQRSTGVAGLVLPVDGDRVLLARHTYGPPVWALLGGTALPDEAPDVAARREVEEESGLQVTTDRLVAICDIGHLMIFIFVGRVVSGTERRQPDEIAELHWFRQDEVEHEPVFNVVPLLVAALGQGRDHLQPGLSLEMVPWPDGTPHPVFMAAHHRVAGT
jgi:ADP-ribose pyrophosphatase YjhB (NUDIX family)